MFMCQLSIYHQDLLIKNTYSSACDLLRALGLTVGGSLGPATCLTEVEAEMDAEKKAAKSKAAEIARLLEAQTTESTVI